MKTERSARRVFTLLIVISLLLLALIIAPFAEGLFFAAVLAGALYPLYARLNRRLSQRRNLSAYLVCAMVVITMLMPVGGVVAFMVRKSAQGAQFVADTVRSEGVAGLAEHLPEPLHSSLDEILERMPTQEQALEELLQKEAAARGGSAARAVTGALAATGSALLQSTLMLIALFFLLVDGAALVRWVEQVSPLKRGQTTEILLEFRRVSVAVLVSSLATAGLQAVVAFIGYLIASVPHPVFFATLTFFIAFVPAVGAGGTGLAVALLMLLLGHPWMALFLAIWAVLVVGLVDNVVKPLLVKRGLDMHGGLVFFALLGGLAVFGGVGLVAGPLIVAFFLALLRIHQRDYGDRPAP